MAASRAFIFGLSWGTLSLIHITVGKTLWCPFAYWIVYACVEVNTDICAYVYVHGYIYSYIYVCVYMYCCCCWSSRNMTWHVFLICSLESGFEWTIGKSLCHWKRAEERIFGKSEHSTPFSFSPEHCGVPEQDCGWKTVFKWLICRAELVFRQTHHCREATISSPLCPICSRCNTIRERWFFLPWISRNCCGQVSVTFNLTTATRWILSTEGKSAAETNCLSLPSKSSQERTVLSVSELKDCGSYKWTFVRAFDTLGHESFL